MTYHEFMDLIGQHFPNGVADMDNDGQLIIYTNLQLITPWENPSSPLGEVVLQDMDVQ